MTLKKEIDVEQILWQAFSPGYYGSDSGFVELFGSTLIASVTQSTLERKLQPVCSYFSGKYCRKP